MERNLKIENERLEIQPLKAQKLKLPNEPILSTVTAYDKRNRGSLGREWLPETDASACGKMVYEANPKRLCLYRGTITSRIDRDYIHN
jgi:hypothetical protein